MMISAFIQSEPHLSYDEIIDKLIIKALLGIFESYGLESDEDLLVCPDNLAYEELSDLEEQIKSTNPSEVLLEIEAASDKFVNEINGPFLLKYLGLEKEAAKRITIKSLHTYAGLNLFNLNNEYNQKCSVLALRILIPMRRNSEVNHNELVTATRLVQALFQCNLLNSFSKQRLAEQLRHYNQDKIDDKNKTFDQEGNNLIKKEIVQGKTLDLLFKNDSLTTQELTKQVTKSTLLEIDKLIELGNIHSDDFDISPSVLKRWVIEAKSIFENADD